MPKYGVTLPVNGSVYVEVDANSEDEAIEKALQSDVTNDDIQEWSTYDELVHGNVFCGSDSHASAELIEEDEE